MRKLIPAYVRVPLIFAIVFGALEYFIDSGNQPAFIKYPMVSLFLVIFLFLLVAIEIVMDAVDNVTYHMLTEEQKDKLKNAQSIPFTQSSFYKNIMKKLTRSKEVEHESDLMLEHDYDGIRELDNVLPPWWVYLFYATILFGVVYIFKYQLSSGNTQADEFKQEVELAQAQQTKTAAATPDNITVDNVVVLTDAADLAKGKEVFGNVCAACHKKDGGGDVGPNLTDEFWINGGGIKNVFKVISEGSKNNASMQPWNKTFKPAEIQRIASYVLSLQGTKPAVAKPAQGEKWVDTAAPSTDAKAPAPAADSTKVATPAPAVK